MTAAPPRGAEVGRAVRRVEDARLLTGAGRFVADAAPAECLHLAFVRAVTAPARLVSLDVRRAAAAPGVAMVLTGADLAAVGAPTVNPAVANIAAPACPPLARDHLPAVGVAYAAVIAASLPQAVDAAELVEAEWQAIEDAPRPAFTHGWTEGDTGAALAGAAIRAEVRQVQPLVAAVPMEPRAAVAEWDEAAATLTLRLSTQTPHRARAELARLLDLAPAQVRVIAVDVGGAFGAKASIYPEEIVVAWAARRLRRPVKWVATRGEEFLSATLGRGMSLSGTLAFDADGRMRGLAARIEAPLGHWLTYSAAMPAVNAGRILPGPYLCPAVDIAVSGTVTGTAAVGIYRGAGRPEAVMLMERLMDDGARRLGMDPVALRRVNLVPEDRFPHPTPTGQTLDSGRYAALLDLACRRADYAGLRREQLLRRGRGELAGVGVAFQVEPCGAGWESARLRIGGDGTAVLETGSSAQGQGRETTLAQIAADALGLPFAALRVVHGDTASTPAGIGALASRSTAIGGSAVIRAAEALRETARPLAARLLQAPPAEVVPTEGGFALAADPGRHVGWAALAAAAEQPLEAEAVFTTPGETWAAGCCIAAVAIDAETGVLRIDRLVWIDDAGRIVNPLLARGQLLGGIAQGLGQVLMERMVHDPDGQVLTGSLMDYAVPRAADMPAVILDHLETPATTNPLGAKGVGEAGTIGMPAALLNAAVDALAPLGVRHLDMPLTPESLWRAISAARTGSEGR